MLHKVVWKDGSCCRVVYAYPPATKWAKGFAWSFLSVLPAEGCGGCGTTSPVSLDWMIISLPMSFWASSTARCACAELVWGVAENGIAAAKANRNRRSRTVKYRMTKIKTFVVNVSRTEKRIRERGRVKLARQLFRGYLLPRY